MYKNAAQIVLLVSFGFCLSYVFPRPEDKEIAELVRPIAELATISEQLARLEEALLRAPAPVTVQPSLTKATAQPTTVAEPARLAEFDLQEHVDQAVSRRTWSHSERLALRETLQALPEQQVDQLLLKLCAAVNEGKIVVTPGASLL